MGVGVATSNESAQLARSQISVIGILHLCVVPNYHTTPFFGFNPQHCQRLCSALVYPVAPWLYVVEALYRNGKLTKKIAFVASRGPEAEEALAMLAEKYDTVDPDDALIYLLPSRYCESDRFGEMASEIVDDLVVAWSWNSVDNETVAANIAAGKAATSPSSYKATPIVVDGVMYVSTSFGRIVALDCLQKRSRRTQVSKSLSAPLEQAGDG